MEHTALKVVFGLLVIFLGARLFYDDRPRAPEIKHAKCVVTGFDTNQKPIWNCEVTIHE